MNSSGAPETTRGLDARDSSIHPRSDIWSLGAVMSETLTWSIMGYEELTAYQGRRHSAVSVSELAGLFHWGCFHDGSARLKEIEKTHTEVVENGNDPITSGVSKMIMDGMLQADYAERWKAGELHKRGQYLLANHDTRVRTQDAHELREGPRRHPSDEYPGTGRQPRPTSNRYIGKQSQDECTSQRSDMLWTHRLSSALYGTQQGQPSHPYQTQATRSQPNGNVPPAASPSPGHVRGLCTVENLYSFIQEKPTFLLGDLTSNSYRTFLSAHPQLKLSLEKVKGLTGRRDQASSLHLHCRLTKYMYGFK